MSLLSRILLLALIVGVTACGKKDSSDSSDVSVRNVFSAAEVDSLKTECLPWAQELALNASDDSENQFSCVHLYVDQVNGSDSFDGIEQKQPAATLEKAFALSRQIVPPQLREEQRVLIVVFVMSLSGDLVIPFEAGDQYIVVSTDL